MKKINFLFEFKTPTGFLPMGYEHKDIPLIFNEYNKIENSEHYQNIGIRFIHDNTRNFERTNFFTDFFDIIKNQDVNNKTIFRKKIFTDLNQDEIENDINLFCITSDHNQIITKQIEHADLDDYFLPKTLEFIKLNKNIKILFIDDKEGALSYKKKFFMKLFNFSKKHNLTNNQIYFITNTFNINSIYINFLNQEKIDSFMNAYCIPFLVYSNVGENILEKKILKKYKNNDKDIYDLLDENELDINRKKYFLSLNRNSERLHRPKLILNIIKNNMFEKGLISLLKSKNFDKFCDNPKNYEYKKLIKEKYPFVVDYEDSDKVSAMHNYFTGKEMWSETYFSIVSETSVMKNSIFITEKSIRPIIYYHPFILWASPYTLKSLKEIGFETFPEFFDETYDLEEDENKRLQMVIENVKKLCELDIDEIHKLYKSIKPKLIHNHNLLIDFYKKNKTLKEFTKILSK